MSSIIKNEIDQIIIEDFIAACKKMKKNKKKVVRSNSKKSINICSNKEEPVKIVHGFVE
jgi:hypothetical protein